MQTARVEQTPEGYRGKISEDNVAARPEGLSDNQ